MGPTERHSFGFVGSVGGRGRGANRLNLGELLTASHHHLGHFLKAHFQLTQRLFGVTVGAVLNSGGLLSAAMDQRFTLLLSLLCLLYTSPSPRD